MAATLTPIQQPSESVSQRPRRLMMPLDPLLTLAVIGLGIFSLVTISVTTQVNQTGNPHYFVERQAIYLGVGLLLMVALSRFDYGLLRQFKYWIYGLLILILLAVLALGSSALGSTRAISLPLFSFQSSEIGKVLLVVFTASLLVDRVRRLHDRQTTALVIALMLVPTVMVIAEPDLGSSLVYISVALGVLFVAGTPWRHFAALGLLAAIALTIALALAPALGVHVLSKYQEERLTGFLTTHVESPEAQRQRYQQEQSKIAIGAGRQTGLPHVGPAQSSFVPFDESDFIFAAVSEQHGFVGAALVLALYALLIWRCMRILTMSRDLYGSLIAAGVTAMLMCQVFVNVGVAVGIMPDTGITLPLMSYGGSSVLTTMLALGLLQSIYVRARSPEGAKSPVGRW